MRRLPILPVLLSFAQVLSVGCGSRKPQVVPPAETWQNLEYDVGEFPAGIEVSHTFALANDLATALHVRKDSDIVPNCGCASLTPATRELAPAATTNVAVKVATRDKGSGPFRYGGRIVWTDAREQTHVASFYLTGVARPPFAFQPYELVFERDEVATGRTKELTVTLDAAVDESSVTLEAPTDALALEKIRSEGGRRVYSVKCLQQPRGEDEETHEIVLAAKLTPQYGCIPVSAILVVHVQEAVPLDVQPKTLDLRPGPEGRAIGKLVLSGEAMKAGGTVHSIECADFKVEWKARRAGPAASSTVLEITLFAPSDKDGPEKSTLQVKVEGLPALHVPIRVRR
jgi:hypothetical protein